MPHMSKINRLIKISMFSTFRGYFGCNHTWYFHHCGRNRSTTDMIMIISINSNYPASFFWGVLIISTAYLRDDRQ